MFEGLDKEHLHQAVDDYFGEKYHCAEAIVAVCFDALDTNGSDAIAHATPFGGGFGKSFSEACGVLSGANIVIGHLYGRRAPGEKWDTPAEMAALFREEFIYRHGSTHCGVLRDRFGEEEQMNECKKLVKEGVESLVKILNDYAAEQVDG